LCKSFESGILCSRKGWNAIIIARLRKRMLGILGLGRVSPRL
jgi:hypothetical protein